jgi:hypothetical protein
MPFKSKAQMRYMFAKHPRIAKRWAREYGVSKNLPEKVKKKTKKSEALDQNDIKGVDMDKVAFINNLEKISYALKAAEDFAAAKAQEEREVEKMIPDVVEALVLHSRIEPHEKAAAAELLKDHRTTLEILARTAAHYSPTNKLGSNYGTEKRASTLGYGPREETEADKVFLRHLGLEHLVE